MKKRNVLKIVSILAFFLIVMFAFSKISFTGEVFKTNKLKLGYCPTMFEEALEISDEKGMELILFSSSAEILEALKNDEIDAGLIGRLAKKIEINEEIEEEILREGYTLVSKERSMILFSNLNFFKIHTYLTESVSHTLIPNSEIIYYDTLDEAVLEGFKRNEPVLISWEDFDDKYELFIPLDEFGRKIKNFRIPVLYYR